jgi:hypothetical protein
MEERIMTQMIDATGLSGEAIRAVESLVDLLPDRQAQPGAGSTSISDLFGKAEVLRRGDDIAEQIREERDSWGER